MKHAAQFNKNPDDINSEKAETAQKFSRQKKDESTYKHTHEIKKDIDFGEVYSMSQGNQPNLIFNIM